MFVVSDVEEMALNLCATAESLCYCILGLSNVLFTAGFSGNAVNEVGTLATDVVFARVFSASGGANEFAFPP